MHMVYYTINRLDLYLVFEGMYMPHRTNTKDHEEEKKDAQGSAPAQQTEKDAAMNTVRTESPKTKSYADIIKGFEEIDKIFKRDKEKGT
jgi:hypothetical protein